MRTKKSMSALLTLSFLLVSLSVLCSGECLAKCSQLDNEGTEKSELCWQYDGSMSADFGIPSPYTIEQNWSAATTHNVSVVLIPLHSFEKSNGVTLAVYQPPLFILNSSFLC